MMRWTITCRTTSALPSWQMDMPSTPLRTFMASFRPLGLSPGRSIWVMSPVMTTLEPKPIRVRNIFICSRLVFWASSRMMKLSSRVRPRI